MNMKPQIKGKSLPVFKPDLQVSFYQRVKILQNSYLTEALSKTVEKMDISTLDKELARYIKPVVLSKLASYGLRGEVLLPVPCILTARPSLLGYYRLLYGLSQKEFYRSSDMACFKQLEEKNDLPTTLAIRLSDLCISLIHTGQLLIEGIDTIDIRIVRDLQLLTLGAQFRGGQNTRLGREATEEVFNIIEKIVHPNIIEQDTRQIVLRNAAGREVIVAFSSDPDIAITEKMKSMTRPSVSVEIKGGTDVSNIHNRIGEAEKSHQKAKSRGFFEFWTIIGAKVDLKTAQRESPTSSRFFYLPDLRNAATSEYKKFRDHLQSVVGIKTR